MAAGPNGHANEGLHKPLNDVFTGLPTTIFTVMTNLATKHQTINLGQGFPDEVLRCTLQSEDWSLRLYMLGLLNMHGQDNAHISHLPYFVCIHEPVPLYLHKLL